jgi:hypothetical protein
VVVGKAFDDAAEVLGSGAVAGKAGEATTDGPAAVTVHDDGDMSGQLRLVDVRCH